MDLEAPFLPVEKLRAVASEFLNKYHMSGKLPIPIERIIEFDFKLDIGPMPGLKDEFDIDAYITSDLTEIRVDSYFQRKVGVRYRFSLAHELAHILIHEDVFKTLNAFSSVSEWKEVMSSIPRETYDWIEFQAYTLAGLMLVPEKALLPMFETKIAEAKKFGVYLQDIDERHRRIVESNIARDFDVSQEVVAKRMKEDGLWGKLKIWNVSAS